MYCKPHANIQKEGRSDSRLPYICGRLGLHVTLRQSIASFGNTEMHCVVCWRGWLSTKPSNPPSHLCLCLGVCQEVCPDVCVCQGMYPLLQSPVQICRCLQDGPTTCSV